MREIVTLIDADTLLWNLSYKLDSAEVDSANDVIDGFVELILRNTNCSYYLGFLGEHKTFRHQVYPEYKANRADNPDWLIKWRPFIRQRLTSHWGFMYSGILEAEDCVSICAYKLQESHNVIIAAIDKDLNMVTGEYINHYNYNKHEFWYSDRFGSLELIQKSKSKKLIGTGLMWYYTQICKGDSTDNIPSLRKGFGDVAIYNLLKNCKTEWQLHCKVYREFLKYSSKEAFILNRILVKMLEEESYGFTMPSLIPRNRVEDTNIEEYIL